MDLAERLARLEAQMGITAAAAVVAADPSVAESDDPAVRDLEAGNRINALARQAETDRVNRRDGHLK